MNRQVLVLLTAAVAFFGLTGWAGVRLLAQLQPAAPQIPTQPVVVAARDVSEGVRLQPHDVVVMPMPATLVPPGALSSIDSIVGRVTRQPLFRQEPVLRGRLAALGQESGLELKIAPGKRAMAIPIDEVVGLSGLIQPNSRVDVLVTMTEVGGAGSKQAKLFMSNMRVLSVGTQTTRDVSVSSAVASAVGATISSSQEKTPSRTATLEVTPNEAERLAVATQQGRIQLVLRGYDDEAPVLTTGASSADLITRATAGSLSQQAEASIASPPPRPRAPRARPVEAPPAPASPLVPPSPGLPSSGAAPGIEVYRGPSVAPVRPPAPAPPSSSSSSSSDRS